MSHVTLIELSVEDLEALAEGGINLGMELLEKRNFKWYGNYVGDHPLPPGFTEQDMGKCDYVLRIKNNAEAYEVGVVRRKDGKPGYVLLWDFWCEGFGLQSTIGENGSKLRQEYSIAVASKAMRRQGFRISREVNEETGKPRIRMRRR